MRGFVPSIQYNLGLTRRFHSKARLLKVRPETIDLSLENGLGYSKPSMSDGSPTQEPPACATKSLRYAFAELSMRRPSQHSTWGHPLALFQLLFLQSYPFAL
jgi:hypothetical protein